jgi:hypothetical protein
VLSPSIVSKLIGKYKIKKIEEYPTFERDEAEVEELKC